jgi:hypothetical protein
MVLAVHYSRLAIHAARRQACQKTEKFKNKTKKMAKTNKIVGSARFCFCRNEI